MADFGSLNDRLAALEARIRSARERLHLHNTPLEDHAATLDELTERYLYLQQELQSETVDLKEHGVHIDSFEKTVLGWVNGLTLKH